MWRWRWRWRWLCRSRSRSGWWWWWWWMMMMMMMMMTMMMMMAAATTTTTTTAYAGSRSLERILCRYFREKHLNILNRKRNTTCAHANYANWGPGAEVPRLCSSSTEEANIIAGWAPGPHCNGTVQMDALKVPMFCNIHGLIYVLNMSKSQQIIFTCIILTCEKLSNWPPSGSKWLFKNSPKAQEYWHDTGASCGTLDDHGAACTQGLESAWCRSTKLC